MENRQFIIRASILSVALVTLGPSGYAASLLGYYTFSDGSGSTVTDQSGNGNNGTLSATGATWVTGVDGGGAINLSQAANGFVNMGNPSLFAFGGSGGSLVSWSVQAWINTTQTTPAIIAGEQVDNVNEGYGIGLGNVDPGCTSSAYDGAAVGYTIDGGGGCVGTAFTPAPATTVNDGNWHQVMVTDDNGVLSLYVDGAFETTTSPNSNGTSSCSGAQFVVGGGSPLGGCSTPGTPVSSFTGSITDVGIWGAALTSSQVEAAYLDPNNPLAATTVTGTPEPDSLALGALGLGALWFLTRRRYLSPMRRCTSSIRGSC